MNQIITLPKQLANQIAAGEVVERPLSVVKEAVENSIDAGATKIEIRLENGGIDLIEVKDNGVWISSDDLPKALEKYSTSKIASIEDLYEVMTFGFRGEALSSISSVSDFSLISKQAKDSGATCISTQWGDETKISQTARDTGTTLRVENLFFNTPARLNYLKKPRTEYLKIFDFIQKIALAYPKISFSLEHDGKRNLYFPENSDVLTRIYTIFWEDFSENALAVEHEFSGVRISWYISDPKVSFQNKTKQALFVNKRIISSPVIFKAISDAYNRFIAHGTHPAYVLFVDLDPTQVDVNVHPRKLEVRFAAENSVFRSVYHAIKDELERVSLVSSDWVDTSISREMPTMNSGVVTDSASPKYYSGSGTKFKNYSPYKDTTANPAQAAIDFSKEILSDTAPVSYENSKEEATILGADLHDTPLWRIVGQVHNSYIVVQTKDGLQILDQHALAERVIYERLASSAYVPKVQQILWGIWMHMSALEQEALENYGALFSDMWFEINALSGGNIIIEWVPDFIKRQNIEKVFRDIVADVSDLWSVSLDEIRHKIWAYAACRSAIKFGDPLSLFEMNALLKDAHSDYSATCPHGRPVVYDVSLEELQKKYER